VGGLSDLTRCLWAGRTAVLADPSPRFEPAAIAAQIARDRVTLVSLVPTMLARLLDQPSWRPPAHLRAVLLGGAPAPVSLLARAADRGLTVHTTYGMTETCSHVAIDGRTLPGIDLALRGGRIAVRGPVLLRGFAPPDDAAPALDPDGWYVTGDRGAFGDDGRLRVLGRADDVIITGGEKVDPRAVEVALEAVPGVDAAVVFGEPDPAWGERVVAALHAVPGAARPGDDALGAALASLARHERPRRIVWLDELPLGPTGKIDRAEVIQRVGRDEP
jgi:O-succinylbenzoic acid--CoA ligase